MKTIFVIYTNALITDKARLRQMKYYSFNTISDVKVGDMLKTNKYDSLLQVVEVLDKCFIYYNAKTGELGNDIYSSEQRGIVELEVIDKSENEIVYATKVNSHE